MVDLVPGAIETVEGTVVSGNNVAPRGFETPCVYGAVLREIYKVGARGWGRPLWYVDGYDVACEGFLVSDCTGQVRVREDGRRMSVRKGHREIAWIGKKKNRRSIGLFIRQGDRLIIRGMVCPPDFPDPNHTFVLSAPPGKEMEMAILRRGKAYENGR